MDVGARAMQEQLPRLRSPTINRLRRHRCWASYLSPTYSEYFLSLCAHEIPSITPYLDDKFFPRRVLRGYKFLSTAMQTKITQALRQQ
jgi:hypothetical protein